MRIESLLQWMRDTPEDQLEHKCASAGLSLGYLRQIAYGNKQALRNAADIELMTERCVTRRDLRPDDWHRIWPELCGRSDLASNEQVSQCE